MIKKGLYRHFKGAYYKVLGTATHSETEEQMVVYQALYAEKGVWLRPLAMFTEEIERDGKILPRFAYCEAQTEVLEVAILDVKSGREADFESTFASAEKILSAMQGYISHRIEACVEQTGRYVLLVEWQTLEDHTIGFRESAEYQEWKALLHEFYEPFPVVQHYSALANSANLTDQETLGS